MELQADVKEKGEGRIEGGRERERKEKGRKKEQAFLLVFREYGPAAQLSSFYSSTDKKFSWSAVGCFKQISEE